MNHWEVKNPLDFFVGGTWESRGTFDSGGGYVMRNIYERHREDPKLVTLSSTCYFEQGGREHWDMELTWDEPHCRIWLNGKSKRYGRVHGWGCPSNDELTTIFMFEQIGSTRNRFWETCRILADGRFEWTCAQRSGKGWQPVAQSEFVRTALE